MKKKLNKTIFLDRDGVINVDSPLYIKSWDEFMFIPGSLEALRILNEKKFDVILITNQSIINRGMVPQNVLKHIFLMMNSKIESSGGKITDIFYCPHTPEEGCTCRKPAPGMIHSARIKHSIDLSFAGMVGDSAKDIACARRAQVRYAVLVKTGNFDKAQQELHDLNLQPDRVAQDLYAAVEWIVEQFQTSRQVDMRYS